MTIQRYQNLPDASPRDHTWAAVRQLMRETKLLQRSIDPKTITWDHSAGLADRLAKTAGDYIVWLGHATYLLQLNDVGILIDPFFSDYASPIQGFGPKRVVPPALTIDALPDIQLVLITHNHYDHLDKCSIKALEKRFSPLMVVPEGLANTLKKWGVHNTHELGWQEAITFNQIKVTALPAYHYSRRGLFDMNRSWWCSFAIEYDELTLFHSGDTGYGKCFRDIGQKFGRFDYAMIGIGAYTPPSMMKAVHLTPEEAVQLALDINAKTLLPMHWGTIPLTPEPFAEPLERVLKMPAVQQNDIDI